ncbi:MAG TPA: glycosyltransferase family 4 protein [Kiritimatiellia bacterium]|nr:glycosyltransferase family 4 protein [Kiritimatiellia bacterium]
MKSKPLRILFINRMAAMVRGGGETFDLEMARHLAALGCEVTLLTGIPLMGRARLGPADWWPGCGIASSHEIENWPLKIGNAHIRTPYLGWFPWDKTPGGWRIRVADFKLFERSAARWAYHRRVRFDVIQICELPFFLDYYKGRESRVPVCMRLTAPDFYDPRGALQRANAVIASGTTMKKVRAGLRPDCHNIPNGVDIALFRPHATDFRAQRGWPADDVVIVSVARFQTVKNHPMLIDAFRRVLASEPKARLVLAGSGPLEGDIRARCAMANVADRVTFLGELPFECVADLYAASDIAVVSSDYESFSFVALEAMATGLPMVVTATEWVPGLIGRTDKQAEDQNPLTGITEAPGGIVAPIGDGAAFADALLRLVRDPDRRRRMGGWNRNRVERDFGWSASAEKLLALYRRLSAS